MAQYNQNVDNSVWVSQPALIPGIRGRARTFPHYPDYLTEKPIGPIRQLNSGHPWTYVPQRIKTFVPNKQVVTVTRNGNFIKQFSFRARAIAEFNVQNCT